MFTIKNSKPAVLIGLTCFGLTVSVWAGVEEDLIKLENDWNAASIKSDVKALGAMLSDDFLSTDSGGRVYNKAQTLEQIGSGQDVVTSAVSDDFKVRVYGDAAVVMARYVGKETFKGKDVSGEYRYTDTWVKRGGRWICVASHGSRLEPEADDAAAKAELMKIEKEVCEGYMKNPAALDRIFTDDFLFITSDGHIRTKAEEVGDLKSGSLKVSQLTVDGLKPRIYGQSAVVTGNFEIKGTSGGKDFAAKGVFTDVLLRQQNTWRIASTHTSMPTGNP
jgi:ketosteroid isomerase-like protein